MVVAARGCLRPSSVCSVVCLQRAALWTSHVDMPGCCLQRQVNPSVMQHNSNYVGHPVHLPVPLTAAGTRCYWAATRCAPPS